MPIVGIQSSYDNQFHPLHLQEGSDRLSSWRGEGLMESWIARNKLTRDSNKQQFLSTSLFDSSFSWFSIWM